MKKVIKYFLCRSKLTTPFSKIVQRMAVEVYIEEAAVIVVIVFCSHAQVIFTTVKVWEK